jgi:hypothetical protein
MSEDLAPEDQLMHALMNKLSDPNFWEDVKSQFQAGKETAYVNINKAANDPMLGAGMATGVAIVVTKAGVFIAGKAPTGRKLEQTIDIQGDAKDVQNLLSQTDQIKQQATEMQQAQVQSRGRSM